jgi:hypothetical protein
MSEAGEVREPAGGLGVLMPGTTTFIAGVELVKKRSGEPAYSLTQFGPARYE